MDRLLSEFERWGYDERGWLPNTRNKYRREVRAADRWVWERYGHHLPSCTTKELKAYLFTKPPNARTRNRCRQALIGFGAFLVSSGVWAENRAVGLPRLPEPDSLPRPLAPEQLFAVLSMARVFPPVVQVLIAVFAYGGLRKSEARLLEWTHLTPDGWLVFRGKGAKTRAVPLHPDAAAAIRSWRLACPNTLPPHTQRLPTPPSTSPDPPSRGLTNAPTCIYGVQTALAACMSVGAG